MTNSMEKQKKVETSGKNLTGYPSIDKPWLKYYSEETNNAVIPSMNMYRMLYESNKNRMKETAINYFDNCISYEKLFENTKKAAKAFSKEGIKKGDIVTIISLNTPETLYCIYALNYIGAVANLQLATSTKHDILENLKETDSKLVLILDKIFEKYGDFQCNIPVIILSVAESVNGLKGQIMRIAGRKNNIFRNYKEFVEVQEKIEALEVDSDMEPAVIIYTSGSTGVPKGVVLSNRNLNAIAVIMSLSGKNYQVGEKFLNILPPFFSFGIGMLHLCLYSGMTEIPVLVPEVDTIINMMKKYRPERLAIGPAFTGVIEKNSATDLSYLVDLAGGGGAISLQKERDLNEILKQKKAGLKYLTGYGMTELASAVSINLNHFYKEQSVGIPLPLINVKIVDPETRVELGYNEEGELLIDSPGLMLGYFKNQEETENIIDVIQGRRWIHTGDLAKIDEDGCFYITGRLKRIYIVKTQDNMAYKLFPQRLEEVIAGMEIIDKCAVIVIPDDEKQNIPVVFVTLKISKDKKNVQDAVKKVIAEQLPIYYEPKDVCVVEELPVTSSQKIDYEKLKNIYGNGNL